MNITTPNYFDQGDSYKNSHKTLPAIREILENDRNMPRKQRHTSRRILERLREEHGNMGSQTIFYEAV